MKSHPVNHPGGCTAYRLEYRGKTLVYLTDHEPFSDAKDQAVREFTRGADLLIREAQYTAEEYQTHLNWGHGCIDEVVRMAITAQVKRLYMFHHDPAHDDRFLSGMLMHARQLVDEARSTLLIEAAREGVEVMLREGVVTSR